MDLKVSKSIAFSIQPEDEFGNATGAFDQAPAWSVQDPALGKVEAAADGLSAVFSPSGKLGATEVQVSGVSDGKTLAGVAAINLIPGDAVSIVLVPGAEADQAVPAAPVAPATPAA